MNIVLVHPEIPQNTGNIARTCAATGTVLHLIEPLGFSLDDRYLKRAGLDYWHLMEYHVYRDEEEFIQKHPGIRAFLLPPRLHVDIMKRNTGTETISSSVARHGACRKTCCKKFTITVSGFLCVKRPGV